MWICSCLGFLLHLARTGQALKPTSNLQVYNWQYIPNSCVRSIWSDAAIHACVAGSTRKARQSVQQLCLCLLALFNLVNKLQVRGWPPAFPFLNCFTFQSTCFKQLSYDMWMWFGNVKCAADQFFCLLSWLTYFCHVNLKRHGPGHFAIHEWIYPPACL